MPSWAKSIGLLLLHTLTAIFGVAIFESAIGGFYHPPDLFHLVVKAYVVSFLLALTIGAIGWKLRPDRTALRVWLAPTVLLIVYGLLKATPTHTVLLPDHNIWQVLTGQSCIAGGYRDCFTWLNTTITVVRCIAYSLGAALAAQFLKPRVVETGQ